MRTLERERSLLLIVDLQGRLMPAIDGGEAVLANARRLLQAARLLGAPVLLTEQNPAGLGPTVAALEAGGVPVAVKTTFDACRAPGFLERLPPERPQTLVVGCEAHVCVLQTVLGLLEAGRQVYLVQDAVGSRRAESKAAALARMARHGAEIVTAEMAIFEWLESSDDPQFRAAISLVK